MIMILKPYHWISKSPYPGFTAISDKITISLKHIIFGIPSNMISLALISLCYLIFDFNFQVSDDSGNTKPSNIENNVSIC